MKKHSALIGLVDHAETYGPEAMRKFISDLPQVETCLDIGAGKGRDLAMVREFHPLADLHAVEFADRNIVKLNAFGVTTHQLDIERDRLPFKDDQLDLIIANQVLEHTKEIFWIFHEATRALKVGGSFIVGVPNVASFHNRLLLGVGRHPTQHKLASAHVRPFSKGDTLRFLEACYPGGYELSGFAGSQFYPTTRTVFCGSRATTVSRPTSGPATRLPSRSSEFGSGIAGNGEVGCGRRP